MPLLSWVFLMVGGCQKGRKVEDGSVPARYSMMRVLTRGGYPKRTEMNVIDSDGTVVFSHGRLSGGSALTRRLAGKHGKSFLYVDLDIDVDHVAVVRHWIAENEIRVLNVAGSRESKHPGIYDLVKEILRGVLLMDGAGEVGEIREMVE